MTLFIEGVKIAYAYWSCICDGESCEECESLEGTTWLPDLVNIEPPLSSCKSEVCRCIAIYVGEEEEGAKDIAAFIRKSGGKVTSKQLKQFEEGG